jgi:NAD(P)-dependent dehydrogenase (short-subunit alcohol dehydrogenase family)
VWDVCDKKVLVTGATSGIGLATSMELARRGAHVIMVGRDAARTERAAAETIARSGSANVSHLLCDFSVQASIRNLVERYRSRYDRLDVLVNNAGGVSKKRRLTVDGIETTFAVNHLGYFLTTNLLGDLLTDSAPARVVTVASYGHRTATLDFDDIGFKRGYSIIKAYKRSKLCNVLFSAALARRLAGTGVTSNSVDPGGVNTNIWSRAPLWAKPIIAVKVKPRLVSPEEGASHVVHLVADPGLEEVTGQYFEADAAVAPALIAQNEDIGRRLWELSAQLVDLRSDGPFA